MMRMALSVDELDHHRIFQSDLQLGDWVWCLHCERAYRYGEYRAVLGGSVREGDSFEGEELQLCPFEDCDGSPLDLWEWDKVRSDHPDYPLVPKRGQEYPLY